MKIYNYAIALVAVITIGGFVGCNQENKLEPVKPYATPVPLQINVGVGKVTSSMIDTKSSGIITTTAFIDEQKINVILVANEQVGKESITEYPVASLYMCNIDADNKVSWTPYNNGNTPLTATANKALVLAHYPSVLPSGASLSNDMTKLTPMIPEEISFGDFSQLNFNLVQIPVTALQGLEVFFSKTDKDYMTGNGGTVVATTSPQVSSEITMKHALAMIVVNITMDPTNPEAGSTISGFNIENVQSKTALQQGEFNLADNAFTPNTNPINYKRQMSGFPINNCFGILTYPANIKIGDVLIKCFVGAATYTYQVPAIEWKSGLVYLYNLKLTAAGVVLNSKVSVVDWPETPIVVKVPIE